MRTALLLSGHFREILFCFPSIKEKIIDEFNPDVFISSWNPGDDFSRSMPAYTFKLKDTANITEVVDMFKPKFIKSEDFNSEFMSKIKSQALELDIYGPMTGEMNPVSVFSMWYKIQSALKLMVDYEELVGEKYDLVIKGRFDINIHNPIITNNDPNIISIPPGYDWKGGINDIFAYGGREAMIHYCNMYDYLASYIIDERIFFHAETLLKHHLFGSKFGVVRPEVRISLRQNNIWEHEIVPENFKNVG